MRARGRQGRGREAQRGRAADHGPQDHAVLDPVGDEGASVPEAPVRWVAEALKLEARRQARLYPGVLFTRRGREVAQHEEGERESGSTQGARIVSRLQTSERRIFLAGTEKRGATRDEPGAGEVARNDPPPFDEAGRARGERPGARGRRAREQQTRLLLPVS